MTVVPAAPEDRAQLLAELAQGAGYAVFDLRGRRIGLFIDVVSPTEIAIRHDGAFIWHRRNVPLEAVASVSTSERTIVLDVDRAALSRGGEAEAERAEPANQEDGDPATADWEERLRPYIGAETTVERAPPAPAGEHLLFVGTPGGYELIERPGGAPKPLELISLGDEYDVPFRVTKVAPSPLPNDARPCAYLEQAPPPQ